VSGKTVEKGLSYEIMDTAFAVHNVLRPGFLESNYESAMVLEVKERGNQVETQVGVPVLYKDQSIGMHVIDEIVDGKITLELKAVADICSIHLQQARSYTKATNLPLAIIIYFGSSRVQSERIANTRENYSCNLKIRPIRD
jgi:GxxExxY protein